MPLKEVLTSFQGRINRSDFWLKGIIPIFVASLILGVLSTTSESLAVICMILNIALIYPAVAVYAKRFHDRGKSAWWVLIGLVPLIGALWLLIDCGILPGTPGDNQFGADPNAQPAPAT